MHLLVPQFIQDNFARGNHRGEIDAASLFVDMSCFSTITDELMAHGQHGAEILSNIMRPVFAALVKPVYEHGGLITGFAGDAFTALFPLDGDPSGVLKAFAAAWRMQQAMSPVIRHSTVYGDFFVNAKVGMGLGEARWGIIRARAGHRAAYYFRGTAIDSSAEAEHLAQPGEIVLSARLYERLESQVTAAPHGGYYRVQSINGELPPPQPIGPPTANLEVQRLFFPEQLSTLNLSGEFRQVVNLFIGLTAVRTEDQLDLFMQSVFELQDRYGGLLNRLDFGDKGVNLLLFWGAPVAYENDIQSALNFILDLQARTSIPINAGVSYQIANAGFVGSFLHEEYTAYGRGVNLAARFMSGTARGEIWVDAQVAERARSQFELEPAGEMVFKGFEEKQAVFVLVDRKSQAESGDPGPLIGRVAELNQVVEFVSPLWSGQFAGTLVICGEAGIGKSRLVREFQHSALLKENLATFVICRTDEVLRTPLGPFRTVLYDFFQQSDSQSEARNKRSFNRQIDELIEETIQTDPALADELDRTRSFVGALLNLHWPDSLFEQLDAQGRYENTLIALTNLLRSLSLRRPVILVVEDVHWLDEDSRRYLLGFERMLVYGESGSYPIAVLLTARVEGQDESYFKGISRQQISLPRLSDGELYQLGALQLKGQLSQELFALLQERSGGNPFFAEQILRYLEEERFLASGFAGWELVPTARENLLPNSVRSVLVARLDRLSTEVKATVQTASVIGMEFELPLLFDLLPEGGKTLESVKDAEKAWIWSQAGESRFIFRHALLREAVYLMQLHAHRQSVHARVAEAMENRYATNLGLHYGELAYHSEMAGKFDKARVFYALAGDLARDNYQNNQAIADYSRALDLTPETEFDTRFMLLMSREALFDLTGARESQRADLVSLDRLLEEIGGAEIAGQRAAVAARWANFRNNTGDYPGAVAAAEQAVSMADHDFAPEVAVQASSIWADGLYRQGRFEEAFQRGQAGLELAHRAHDRKGESRLLNLLGWIAFEYKGAGEARDYFQRSLEIARALGDLRLEAMPLNNLGILASGERDYPAARGYYEKALQISREIGSRRGEGLVLANLGWIAKIQADYSEALVCMEQSLRSAREVEDLFQEAYVLANLSALVFNLGDYSSAMAYAGEGLTLSLETGDRSATAWCLIAQGNVYLKIGAILRSQEAYQEALEIRQTLGQPNLACEAQAGLAQAALAQQDLTTARDHTEAILAHLQGGGSLEGVEEPVWVYWTCFRVLQATGDPRAGSILESAYTQLQIQAAHIARDDLRQSFLFNIEANRAILEAWHGPQDSQSI
jgi:class 3 adenylate cyclase/tetratricopeptide (TPR) repeat protein